MDRRTYLGTVGIAGLTSGAGCLGGALGGGSENTDGTDTVLGPPDQTRGDPSYPIRGEEFPSFSLEDPLAEKLISLEDFVGERPFVITYFYASCPDGMCQQLLQHLRRIQEDAIESGYEDEVGLLAMTFDPNRDTADALRTHANRIGIDPDAGHWHFLRPEDNETAKTVYNETFGLPLRRNENGSTTNSTNESTTESSDTDDGDYTFTHSALVQLVNDRGIVERAYPKASTQREGVNTQVMVDDTRTVVGVDE